MSNELTLSLRLSTIAGMVTKGYSLADVGTDHAYLPIALIREGTCPRAIASDLSEDSVLKAKENVRRAGLSGQIEVFARDGLTAYHEGDADALVISGLGGPLMIRILDSAEVLAKSFKELILSPQSEIESVRVWLCEHGFRLLDEALVHDGRHHYVIMKACAGEETAYASEGALRRIQLRYGPLLLRNQEPELIRFLEEETARLSAAITAASSADHPRAQARKEELIRQKEDACSALKFLTI